MGARFFYNHVFMESQFPRLGEGAEAAVVGFLDVIRETTGRQLFHSKVVAYTLTTYTLFTTAGI